MRYCFHGRYERLRATHNRHTESAPFKRRPEFVHALQLIPPSACRKTRQTGSRYVATASFSRGNGEEAVSVATGIGVLANNGSSGIYTHRYGTDGVEWRRDRNVKRYRR